MKTKIWLFQIPVVAIFAGAFWVNEAGLRGELGSAWLREKAFPVLQEISGKFTNLKFQVRGPQPPRNKVVIVEIDSDSLEAYGRWPWHRDKTAELVQSIYDAGAKAVGLDIVFSEPDIRIGDKLARFMESRGLASEARNFETDQDLENVIAFNADSLVLGWTSELHCQPAFDRTCALGNPPADTHKFSFGPLAGGPEAWARSPLPEASTFLFNIEAFNAQAQHAGFFTALPDNDGYIRRTPLVFSSGGKLYPSLALELARVALGEEIDARVDADGKLSRLAFKKSGSAIATSPLGVMEVNFRGPTASFQYVRALEVLAPRDEIRIQAGRTIATVSKRETLKDAIVLVGISALGVYDMRAFPFDSNTPGVEGHANILDNILSGDMLRHGDGKMGTFWMLLAMTLGTLLFAVATERLESIPALALFIGVMGGGFYVDQKLLFENQQNWNTAFLAIELFMVFAFTLAAKYVMEEKNKKFIRGAFAKYVSPAIIDSIMKDPARLTVGGEKKELSILFSDIRSFTSFSEKMDAKQLATFLNDYLGKMTDIVFDTEGTLDKYIGDAVMAFWGAPLDQPKHAANSVRAAIQMQRLLAQERPRLLSQYGVDVQIGIGINTGSVNVGNMGSERIFEYTVIGDHVNLASRLEGLTKDYHASILTTRGTLDEIARSGEPVPPHRVLDHVKVKGKTQAVELVQILDRELPASGLHAFEEGRALYLARSWDQAIASFRRASMELGHDGQPDAMSLEYVERCEEFKKKPPFPDWDGAWVMKTK